MTNPSDILTALVTFLRSIPDLVQAMGGDENAIAAYHDVYPTDNNLENAKRSIPSPGILVAHQTSSFENAEAWKHQISLFVRAAESVGEDPPKSYGYLFKKIIDGRQGGDGPTFLQANMVLDENDAPLTDIVSVSFGQVADSEEIEYRELLLVFQDRWG